jgi:hypothetical protein
MQSEDEQKAIEAAFVESWDKLQMLFEWYTNAHTVEFTKPTLTFVAELRQRGYDHKFRAGSSLFTFILSRSREWGLRQGQAHLNFTINHLGNMEVSYRESDNFTTNFEVERIEITPEIEALLERLLAQPID